MNPTSGSPDRFPRSPRTALAALAFAALLLASPPPSIVAAPAPSGPHADLTGWQALLNQYCIRILEKNRVVDTRFDYEQLYVDEGIWQKHASARLAAARAQLFAVPPSTLGPLERRAWALNAYNFLVVERATLHLLVPGRQFLRYSSVDQMIVGMGGFFDAPVVTLEGREYSIGQFERTFVYEDSTPPIERRTRPGDPRLRFALCRGSLGSAALPVRAFRADSLERQLVEVTRNALATPRLLLFDPAGPTLVAQEFIGEQTGDYTAEGGSLLGFLEKYGPSPLRSAIRGHKVQAVTRFQQTDGSLNQFARPKPQAPAAQGRKPD